MSSASSHPVTSIRLLCLAAILTTGLASGCSGNEATTADVVPNQVPAPDIQTSGFATEQITDQLVRPWSLAFLPDGRMLVTEKQGNLRFVDQQGNISAPLAGLPAVDANGQGGLLDVALSPNFAADAQVFITFSEPAGNGLARTAVASAQLKDMELTDLRVIFRQSEAVSGGFHYGSRLAFDSTGNLLVTLGDRGQAASAQQGDSHLGKVVRIQPDGMVPADNPWPARNDIQPEILSIGHRNPQGAAIHPVSGALWIHEHGPLGGDEVNRIVAGANFGWPRITYGRDYGTGEPVGEGTEADDVEPPIHYWIPTSVAPSGMAFYTGDQVPALTGRLLIGALADRELIALDLAGDQVVGETRLLTELNARIRDVRNGPDGHPYLLTDDGQLLRVVVTGASDG